MARLLWELRFSRDGWQVQTAQAKGRDLPEWYLDEPEIWPGDDFYLSAFYELSTTRSLAFATGPIPWHHIVGYADQAGLDEDMSGTFHAVIRAMDNAYLKWASEEAEKRSRQNSGS